MPRAVPHVAAKPPPAAALRQAPEGGRLPPDLDASVLDPPPAEAAAASSKQQRPAEPAVVAGSHASLPLGRGAGAPHAPPAGLVCNLSAAHAAAAALPPWSLVDLGPEPLAAALAGPYEPRSLGPWAAREALAAWLGWAGRPTEPDDLVLTTSTSEAFSFLFKWAGAPGARVGHMQPGYPLAGHLAELEGLVPEPLACVFDGTHWRLSLEAVERAVRGGVRLLVLTSPNNPTGVALSPAEQAALAALCNAHGVLCIVDEVFAPFGHEASSLPPSPLAGCEFVVSLGGLSKAALLPQLKISWISLHGSAAFRARARVALTWVADAYLSVSPVGAALVPAVCARMGERQARLRARLASNKAWLAAFLARERLGRLWPTEAGFVAPLTLAVDGRQVAAAGMSLEPSALFDLGAPSPHVACLLLPPATLAAGWQAVATAAAAGSDP